MTPSDPPRRRVRVLAAALGALAMLEVAGAGTAAAQVGWSWADALEAFVVTNGVMGLTFGGCGAILAWHRSRNPIGWLFLGAGLAHATSAVAAPATLLADQVGAPAPVVRGLVTVFVYA